MEITIADWGIELAFIRTKVGEEFSVAEDLAASGEGSTSQFFGTYGYFDLVAIRTIVTLNTPHLVLLHRNVTESAPFRFFADSISSGRKTVEDALKNARAAIAVFAKVHPRLIATDVVTMRATAAKKVRGSFPEAHLFFGSGFSELLLIATGDDLPALLAAVTKLRTIADASGGHPLFSKTTTFPFVSVANIHRGARYTELFGTVEPGYNALVRAGVGASDCGRVNCSRHNHTKHLREKRPPLSVEGPNIVIVTRRVFNGFAQEVGWD